MKLGDIASTDFENMARKTGVRYQTGPFNINLKTQNRSLLLFLHQFYASAQTVASEEFCQFHIDISRSQGLRRFLRPKALFAMDSINPFEPYPYDHAFPMLEWGLNFCIGTSANQYLMLHSAAVERNGKAMILPALPGSGKSTLCAGLINRGWRLLSDEFGIIDLETGQVIPLPRSIPLKNQSIEVIRNFAPEALMGPLYKKTRKGDVMHLAPPPESLLRQFEPARPAWVVFPKYEEGAKAELSVENTAMAFTRLSNNSFNYKVTMERGYHALTKLTRQVKCYRLISGDLEETIDLLSAMADRETS